MNRVRHRSLTPHVVTTAPPRRLPAPAGGWMRAARSSARALTIDLRDRDCRPDLPFGRAGSQQSERLRSCAERREGPLVAGVHGFWSEAQVHTFAHRDHRRAAAARVSGPHGALFGQRRVAELPCGSSSNAGARCVRPTSAISRLRTKTRASLVSRVGSACFTTGDSLRRAATGAAEPMALLSPGRRVERLADRAKIVARRARVNRCASNRRPGGPFIDTTCRLLQTMDTTRGRTRRAVLSSHASGAAAPLLAATNGCRRTFGPRCVAAPWTCEPRPAARAGSRSARSTRVETTNGRGPSSSNRESARLGRTTDTRLLSTRDTRVAFEAAARAGGSRDRRVRRDPPRMALREKRHRWEDRGAFAVGGTLTRPK